MRIDRHDWARSPLWLGGLFAPEAFITATRQEVSQRLECSLEELTLQGRNLHVFGVLCILIFEHGLLLVLYLFCFALILN